MYKKKFIAVIIPCYKVDIKTTINSIKEIPVFVEVIYLVDDVCPYYTGKNKSKKTKSESVN